MRRWVLFIAVVGSVIAIDQITKNWALANLQFGQTFVPVPALHPFFQLTLSQNTGAAFGIFPDAGTAFLILSILITGVLFWMYLRAPQNAYLMFIGLSLIIGGAVGNVVDRIQHGYVVDFVHLRIPDLISNVSNLADHAIVLGVLILLIDNFRRHPESEAEPETVD